jgi:hypothetical protein
MDLNTSSSLNTPVRQASRVSLTGIWILVTGTWRLEASSG